MRRPSRDSRLAHSLTDRAYAHVRGLIMTYALKPGDSVSEVAVAQSLTMSRTPVRDALRRLSQEGFLTTNQGKGWRVYTLSLADLRDIFALKIAIESIIVSEVAEKESSSKDEIRKHLSCMERAAEERDLEAWRKADLDLHDAIFSMSGNARAVKIVKDLNDQWYRFQIRYVPLDLQRRQAEHSAFVQRMLAGDPISARRLYEEHLTHLRTEIEYVLDKLIFPLTNNRI